MALTREEIVEVVKQDCSYLLYGQCTARACFVRAGYIEGSTEGFIPTCPYRQIVETDADLRAQLAQVTAERDEANRTILNDRQETWRIVGERNEAQRQLAEREAERDDYKKQAEALMSAIDQLKATVERLEQERDHPVLGDFIKAVPLEAAHQRERWGVEHDAYKTDADWFWLVGYLAGKAFHLPEKRLHHIITAAAALANWHLYTVKQQAENITDATPT